MSDSVQACVEKLSIRSPAGDDLLQEIECASIADVHGAVRAAREAQSSWAKLDIEARATQLLRFRDVLVENTDALVTTLVAETGKAKQEALLQEVFLLADYWTWVADAARSALSPEDIQLHLMKHRRSVIRYEPRRLTAVISPWNYPLLIPFSGVAAALISGSAALVKPSEHTPLTAKFVESLWQKSAMLPQLLQVLVGPAATAKALIEEVDQVLFTGSVANGRQVAQACARRLIPCTLELGGLAPLIVLADADLERAAHAICFGAFSNAGQACIAVERIYAQNSIYESLIERVAQSARKLRVGDPRRREVDVGAVTVEAQLELALSHVQDAKQRGARLVAGGRRLPIAGRFMEPTILADCDHSMRVMTEESFAPIAPMMPFAELDEAVELANDSSLGLSAYLFTSNPKVAQDVAPRIEAGSVVVNDVLSHYGCPEVPLEGIKQSGLGSVHGAHSLQRLCSVRHISTARFPSPSKDPIWYPYNAAAYAIGRRTLKSWFSSRGWLRRAGKLF